MSFKPRNEVPDPSFRRPQYYSLNGEWEFEFDDSDEGISQHWELPARKPFSHKIMVPFCFQSELSGIGDRGFHDVVWYRRELSIPERLKKSDERVFIRFGAVDYQATVYLNGVQVGQHTGGFTPFECDLTDFLQESGNILAVRVWDPSTDRTIPRGKQYWKEQIEGIFYDRVTGIWQSVWLEGRKRTWIKSVQLTPCLDPPKVDVVVECEGEISPETHVELQLSYLKNKYGQFIIPLGSILGKSHHDSDFRGTISIDLSKLVQDKEKYPYGVYWTPETPNLVDVDLYLFDDEIMLDEVTSYFGLRTITIESGKICLNGQPLYQKLLLYQYYWPEGLYTAPSDGDFARDISQMKQMGFNGVRIHQAVADPRFLYECDRAGFLVWGEYANAMGYNPDSCARLLKEWQEAVLRDYNHPCIITWVPMNESWGATNLMEDERQREFLRTLYHLTKSMDQSRLISENDGWEHVKTDICSIHQYNDPTFLEKVFPVDLDDFEDDDFNHMTGGRWIYVGDTRYSGEPIIFSEVGGYGMDLDALQRKSSREEAWGYGKLLTSSEDLEDYYGRMARQYGKRKWIQGFCYTEFCDVFQEKNGLVTFDRRPKVNPQVIRKINEEITQN